MTITSSGYDGSVTEVQMAGMVPMSGTSQYGVDKAGDFAVTAVAGQDRTVNIASGIAWGHFIRDVSDANETAALTAPVSGSRWDMVCLHRDWQPVGGTTTVKVIEGGSSSTSLPKRDNTPGVLDDQPLALVRTDAGSTAIGSIIDLRCWGRNGGITAKDTRVLQYLTAVGTTVEVNGVTHQRLMDPNYTPYWQKVTRHEDTGWVNGTVAAGWTAQYFAYKKSGPLTEVKFRGSYNKEIGSDANSNIENIVFGTIPSGAAPTYANGALASAATGPLTSGSVGTGGECALASIAPNSKFPAGYQFSLTGMFFNE